MARCLLIPGMGADARMLAPQRAALPEVGVLEWIEPAAPDEPITEYAARLAAKVGTSIPFLLGGVSFGAVMALEVARHAKPAAVLLIAGWRSPAALPLHARLLAATGPWAPVWPFRLAVRSDIVARIFGLHTKEQRRLFADMFRCASPAFLHWAARAIAGWRGAEALDVPVLHLHGAEDRIVPARGVDADIVVHGAGHLVNLTHPTAVNDFLAQEIGAWL